MNTDANKPATFGFNSNGQIVTTPVSRDNAGLYNFQLKACVQVGLISKCQFSNTLPSSQFTIVIVDPCTLDEIIASSWPDVLYARQLEDDSINLAIVIPRAGGIWPWYSSVEKVLNFNACGPMAYSVTFENGSVQYMVTLDSDSTLKFSPTLVNKPGIYGFRLTAILLDYGITKSVPFTGEVGDCVPRLDGTIANAMLTDDVQIVWGNPFLQADLSPLMTGFTQTPNCKYDLVTIPKIWYTNKS